MVLQNRDADAHMYCKRLIDKYLSQGGMKSLWSFMRDKKLHYAIRCSMENSGKFDYVDNEDNAEVRHVRICPMYAVAKIEEVKHGIEK